MTASLVHINPITITEAMLATDVPETDYAAWNAGTAYAIGARVIRTTAATHKIYERKVAGTTATAPESDSANWLEVSPTNRWKPFDTKNSSKASQAGSMYFEITPDQVITGLAVLGAKCSELQIRYTDPVEGLVYDETLNMLGTIPESTWHSWLFSDVTYKSKHIALDLPSYTDGTLRLDFTGDANVEVAVIVVGKAVTLGSGVRRGAGLGIQDYSRTEPDDFGEINFVRRMNLKRTELDVRCKNNELEWIYEYLRGVTATPSVWVADNDNFPVLTLLGFFKNLRVQIPYATESDMSLEIHEVT